MQERKRFAVASFLSVVGVNFGLMVGAYLVFAETMWEREVVAPFFAAGLVGTFALWLLVLAFGRRYIDRAAAGREPVSESAESASPAPDDTAAAIQMLSILQREGRLIDFLQEDLSRHDDAQIGAAVRSIHAELKRALAEHVVLEPVFQDQEGADVTIDAGFDPRAVRLTGNVTGAPPFRGEVRHRGWRVVRLNLPRRTSGQDGGKAVLAPAEVEVRSPAV